MTAAHPRLTEADRSAFAASATELISEYAGRLAELRERFRSLTEAELEGAEVTVPLRLLQGEEETVRAGAEQLARFASQEIEQGGLSRSDALRLSVRLTEFERAIEWTRRILQNHDAPSDSSTSVGESLTGTAAREARSHAREQAGPALERSAEIRSGGFQPPTDGAAVSDRPHSLRREPAAGSRRYDASRFALERFAERPSGWGSSTRQRGADPFGPRWRVGLIG